jgi:hypothetical protein
MDRQELLVPLAHNAGHVFVKLFLVLLLNQIGTALHGKDNLDVNLGIGVSHTFAIMRRIALGGASRNGGDVSLP